MPSFAAGVVKFQKDVFPKKKALFEILSEGQAPEALFITCSDSRIETGMITQTDPGELFVIRNAGNIVPPYKTNAGGVTASVEFALEVLNVGHIVICGHSDCGAMKGAQDPASIAHLPHVSEWLSFSADAVARVDRKYPDLTGDARTKMVTRENVVLQLENLARHPSVARRLEAETVKTHGWVYDIKSGHVYIYDDAKGDFVPIEEKYADRFAAVAKDVGGAGGPCCEPNGE